VPVTRNGVAYVLTDTAGLIDTLDPIEAIGVTRAEGALAAADIVMWLADTAPPRADAIWIHARADLPGRGEMPADRTLAVSQTDRESLDALWGELHRRAIAMLPRGDEIALKQHQRRQCAAAVEALWYRSSDALVVAEHLRQARAILTGVLGLDATGEMLDALFGRFCIGK